jgi:hypothetical protein
VLDDECHRNALNYTSASLSTMPMLRFELFQLCHGKRVKMFLYFAFFTPVFGGVRVAHLFSFPALWCAQSWQCFLIVVSGFHNVSIVIFPKFFLFFQDIIGW